MLHINSKAFVKIFVLIKSKLFSWNVKRTEIARQRRTDYFIGAHSSTSRC